MPATFVGTAGWALPRASAHRFAATGTHLQRYAQHFRCVEINSSFHRPHSAATYAKWAAATPSGFRFAVKMPRSITHDRKLRRVAPLVDQFFSECRGLGDRLGPILVQLPPSLEFSPRAAASFFTLLRLRFTGPIVCEPRHTTWLDVRVDALFNTHRIARVAADPPRVPEFAQPGGWSGIVYLRLHGSPRTYWSRYPRERIEAFARLLRSADAADRWCVFDNTASGAAIENAWEMKALTALL
jgi:uncharacterized protein YecE (DUF72 family)